MTQAAPRLDDRIVNRGRTLGCAVSWVLILAGGLTLAGWAYDVEPLKGGHGGITTKANAAVLLVLAGGSLWLLCVRRQSAVSRLVGQALALLVGVTGAATLSQDLFGWDLGIDQLLFTERPGALATTSPGRVGPPGSASFTLAGLSLFLLHARRAPQLAQSAALGIATVSLLAITGYAYSVDMLYGVAGFTGIALRTAVALLFLSLGLLAASADRGFAAIVAGPGTGSIMTRRLLAFAVIVPLLLGWINLQLERAGYIDAPFATAALMLAIIAILTGLIVRTALRVNRIEQQQLVAEAQLRDRLHEIEMMMEVLPIGLFIATDRSARQIVGNRAAREFLRIPETDGNLSLSAPAGEAPIHFRVFRDGVEVAPEDLPVQRAACEGVAIHNVELDVVFADGEVKRELLSALPLLDAQGVPRGAVASVMDITARRAAEKEREELLVREREARAQAEAANRAKDEFLATVSHELRTPLTAILGWASMLREGTVRDPAMVEHALATIERGAKAQAQLIDDLLDVSRIRAGMLRLDMRPVDLAGVVKAAADVVRPVADAAGTELRVLLDDGACEVHGDATRLQQVVWNLLTNAVKFSGRGSVVEARLSVSETEALLTVTDTGEGIDPGLLPHVFDRFWQAESGRTRRHGGLGLGLSIARDLVELHGGAIEAASDGPGRGARFTVRLPRSPSAEVAAAARPQVAEATAAPPPTAKPPTE